MNNKRSGYYKVSIKKTGWFQKIKFLSYLIRWKKNTSNYALYANCLKDNPSYKPDKIKRLSKQQYRDLS